MAMMVAISGSTGDPKPTLGTHVGVPNLCGYLPTFPLCSRPKLREIPMLPYRTCVGNQKLQDLS